MHYEIVADAAGVVSEVMAVAGKQVAADDLLVVIAVTEHDTGSEPALRTAIEPEHF